MSRIKMKHEKQMKGQQEAAWHSGGWGVIRNPGSSATTEQALSQLRIHETLSQK